MDIVKVQHLVKYGQMKYQHGATSIVMLVMAMAVGVALSGLVLMAANQYDFTSRLEQREKALAIADAGVQYYRWHLAHNPDDYSDGTGGQPGPYVHEYRDPQGDILGYYSLNITPPDDGYTNVTIESTAWTVANPLLMRKVTAVFGIPSLAQYSFLHNANVWFGAGLTVHGRVMSNGGIRQDGVNDSVISSARETYTCGSETGCSPSANRPGVWGDGGPSELWEYPVPPADFGAINVDFGVMRDAAQAEGVYLAPAGQGYHLVFNADGTVRVYRVNNTQFYRGYDTDAGCVNLYQRIQNQTLIGNYSLQTKKIFLIEADVWVEGVVNGRATVAAARFPLGSNNKDIWIMNNLTYLEKTDEHSLGLIAQRNIYFSRDIPESFEVNAALLAQNGKIIRHYYGLSSCGGWTNHAVKDNLTIFGSVISSQKSYWNWGSPPVSGFEARDVSYDSNLYLLPPPYFPAEGDYEFISWDEE